MRTHCQPAKNELKSYEIGECIWANRGGIMAKKVSVINMKGGVGKSTLAVNLAWHFAAMSNWKKNVLLVDLDPQFNASQYLL